MKKSKKKFIMFAILSVLLMANMKNVNAGQVQKNDKSVAIEELGCYYRTDLQRYYYVYMDANEWRKCICSQSYFSFRIKWKYGI